MDISVQYVEAVKGDFCSQDDLGQLWSNRKRGSCTMGSLVAELGSTLEHAIVLLSTSAPSLEGCEAFCLEKEKDLNDPIIDQDESLIVTPQKKLGEQVMQPRFRNVLLFDAPVSGKDEISNAASGGQSSLELGNSTSTSIVSLPVSLKPASAIKGSREKQGLNVEKLSVSWAPDVYDPPVTSQSHTVPSYNQHSSKTSKKSHRHKHKGKSPQSDKKQCCKNVKKSSKVSSS